jgi:MFS family permease
MGSILIRALVEEFHWSRSAAAASFGAVALSSLALPFIGRLIDKMGERRLAAASFVLLGAGYFGMTQITGNILTFYATLLLTMVLGAGSGPVAFARVISRRFSNARGFALALMLCGTSVTPIVMAPLLSHLITLYGWQSGFLVLAGTAIFIGAPLSWFGLPDVARTPANVAGKRDISQTGMSLATALRGRRFWLLAIIVLLTGTAMSGFTTSLVSIFVDRGLDTQAAAAMVSFLAIGVLVGRMGSGYLIDRLWAPLVAAVLFAAASVGALMILFGGGAPGIAIAGILLLGLAQGAEFDLLAYFVSRYFGMKSYGAIYGTITMSFLCSIPIGAVTFGSFRDHFGGFDLGIIVSAVALFAAAALTLLLGKYPVHFTEEANALPAPAPVNEKE